MDAFLLMRAGLVSFLNYVGLKTSIHSSFKDGPHLDAAERPDPAR